MISAPWTSDEGGVSPRGEERGEDGGAGAAVGGFLTGDKDFLVLVDHLA